MTRRRLLGTCGGGLRVAKRFSDLRSPKRVLQFCNYVADCSSRCQRPRRPACSAYGHQVATAAFDKVIRIEALHEVRSRHRYADVKVSHGTGQLLSVYRHYPGQLHSTTTRTIALQRYLMNQKTIELFRKVEPAALETMDLEDVSRYNERIEEIGRRSTQDSVQAQSWRLRDDLGALCCDGDPQAPVVYLQANPSFDDAATRETHYQPHPAFPLSVAGTHIYPPTLAYYHNQVFLHLQQEGVSLEQISRKLVKIELCPWASKKWPGNNELQRLLSEFPSRKPIIRLVEHLVEQGAIFVIARAWTPWFAAVPALKPLIGVRVFKSRAPVSPYISSGSYPDGWSAILSAMKS